jgi:hypothetical protein
LFILDKLNQRRVEEKLRDIAREDEEEQGDGNLDK